MKFMAYGAFAFTFFEAYEYPLYYAAVVHQALGQEQSIKTFFHNLKKQEKVLGGYAYLDGPFFLSNLSQQSVRNIRKLTFFAVTVRSDRIFE
jgi:hypothetical protein